MATVKDGDTVKIHYTGKLDDGSIFDTSKDRDPLEFTIGMEEIISGFEKAVVGMNTGDSKTVKVTSDEAYGPHLKELVATVKLEEFPEQLNPEVGQQLQIPQENGKKLIVSVTDISGSNVTLDANHPLAGKNLTFEIELVEIL